VDKHLSDSLRDPEEGDLRDMPEGLRCKVDKIYVLHPCKRKPGKKEKPSLLLLLKRFKGFYADIQRKPAFLVLCAIGKMLFPLLMFQLAALVMLLPLMVGKCR
jgi:hypothetical protein